MGVEINTSCGAPENIAVLNGAYDILVVEAPEVDWQLFKEFEYFRCLIGHSSGGRSIPCKNRHGVISAVGQFVAVPVRACGGAGKRSILDLAMEQVMESEANDLLVIPEPFQQTGRIGAFH